MMPHPAHGKIRLVLNSMRWLAPVPQLSHAALLLPVSFAGVVEISP